MDFFTGGVVVMDCGLSKLKKPYRWICFEGLKSSRLIVDYCDVFISSLYSLSNGTHSLQRIQKM